MMGGEQPGMDPKLAQQERDEKLAQEEINKLTDGELARTLATYREVGITMRNGILTLVRGVPIRQRLNDHLRAAIEQGEIDDWSAEGPFPHDPERRNWQPPKIDAKEVLKRIQKSDELLAAESGYVENQLLAWLDFLNRLAQTYHLNFWMDKESLIQAAISPGARDHWGKLNQRKYYQPDELVMAKFEEAIKARLWELTTPEGKIK